MKSRRSTVARAALLALVSFLAATLVPRDAFYVHRHAADGRPSKVITAAGVLAVIYLIVFTIYGYLAA